MNPYIPEDVKGFIEERTALGMQFGEVMSELLFAFKDKYPDLVVQFDIQVKGGINIWDSLDYVPLNLIDRNRMDRRYDRLSAEIEVCMIERDDSDFGDYLIEEERNEYYKLTSLNDSGKHLNKKQQQRLEELEREQLISQLDYLWDNTDHPGDYLKWNDENEWNVLGEIVNGNAREDIYEDLVVNSGVGADVGVEQGSIESLYIINDILRDYLPGKTASTKKVATNSLLPKDVQELIADATALGMQSSEIIDEIRAKFGITYPGLVEQLEAQKYAGKVGIDLWDGVEYIPWDKLNKTMMGNKVKQLQDKIGNRIRRETDWNEVIESEYEAEEPFYISREDQEILKEAIDHDDTDTYREILAKITNAYQESEWESDDPDSWLESVELSNEYRLLNSIVYLNFGGRESVYTVCAPLPLSQVEIGDEALEPGTSEYMKEVNRILRKYVDNTERTASIKKAATDGEFPAGYKEFIEDMISLGFQKSEIVAELEKSEWATKYPFLVAGTISVINSGWDDSPFNHIVYNVIEDEVRAVKEEASERLKGRSQESKPHNFIELWMGFAGVADGTDYDQRQLIFNKFRRDLPSIRVDYFLDMSRVKPIIDRIWDEELDIVKEGILARSWVESVDDRGDHGLWIKVKVDLEDVWNDFTATYRNLDEYKIRWEGLRHSETSAWQTMFEIEFHKIKQQLFYYIDKLNSMVDKILDDCLFLWDVLASTREIVNNKVSTNAEIFPLTETRQASDYDKEGLVKMSETDEERYRRLLGRRGYTTTPDEDVLEMRALGLQSSEIWEEMARERWVFNESFSEVESWAERWNHKEVWLLVQDMKRIFRDRRQASLVKEAYRCTEEEVNVAVNDFVAYLEKVDAAVLEMIGLGLESSEIMEELKISELKSEDKWGSIFVLESLMAQGKFNFIDKYDLSQRIESVKRYGETNKQIEEKLKEAQEYEKRLGITNTNTDTITEWLGESVADEVCNHSNDGLEWNIKVHGVNIPEEALSKIDEHTLNEIYESQAADYITMMGDELRSKYAWAKDWQQLGRMGGWFVIEPEWNDISDMLVDVWKNMASYGEYSLTDELIDGAFMNIDYGSFMLDKLEEIKENINNIEQEAISLRGEINDAGKYINKMVKEFIAKMEDVDFWRNYYPKEEQAEVGQGMEREAALEYVPQDFIDLVQEARDLGMQDSEIHDLIIQTFGGKYDTLIMQAKEQMENETFNYHDKFNALVYSPPLPDILGPLDQTAINDDLASWEDVARNRFEETVDQNIGQWETEEEINEIGLIHMLNMVRDEGERMRSNNLLYVIRYPKEDVLRFLVEGEYVKSGDGEEGYTGDDYIEFIMSIIEHNELDWTKMNERIRQIREDALQQAWDDFNEDDELIGYIREKGNWPSDEHQEWIGEKEIDIYELLSSLRNSLDWGWWRTRWTLADLKRVLKSYIIHRGTPENIDVSMSTLVPQGDVPQ